MIAEFSRSRSARSGSKAPAPDEVDTPTGEAGGEGPAEAKARIARDWKSTEWMFKKMGDL